MVLVDPLGISPTEVSRGIRRISESSTDSTDSKAEFLDYHKNYVVQEYSQRYDPEQLYLSCGPSSSQLYPWSELQMLMHNSESSACEGATASENSRLVQEETQHARHKRKSRSRKFRRGFVRLSFFLGGLTQPQDDDDWKHAMWGIGK